MFPDKVRECARKGGADDEERFYPWNVRGEFGLMVTLITSRTARRLFTRARTTRRTSWSWGSPPMASPPLIRSPYPPKCSISLWSRAIAPCVWLRGTRLESSSLSISNHLSFQIWKQSTIDSWNQGVSLTFSHYQTRWSVYNWYPQ